MIGYAAPVAQTTDETVDTSGVNWWGFLGGLVGVGGDSSVASDKMPTNTDTSHTTPSTQASTVESTVIRAYYLNQDTAKFSGSLNNPFNTGSLKYTGKAVTMSESDLLAKYTKIYGDNQISQNIQAAYRSDSDGDGVIDVWDKKSKYLGRIGTRFYVFS